MFNWKIKQDITASNAIFLEDENGQQGRPFKARFLQAGLVKYDFGVCLLKKETIDKFINTFVGCPVIINHKNDLTADDSVGTINKIWFSAEDGWFWCSGFLTNDEAIKLIENGYNISCQYRITDYLENIEGKLHNANPYDKEILDGVFEHLAIVENPRYEDAFIAVNAILAQNEDKEEKTAINSFVEQFKDAIYQVLAEEIVKHIQASNGFITTDEIDEDGKRKVIFIPGNAYIGDKAKKRIFSIVEEYKLGDEPKYDFSHTRVKPTEKEIKLLKDTVNNLMSEYKFKGIAQIEISSELNKGSLGICCSPEKSSVISLSPQLYNGKFTQAKYDKNVKEGWSPKGTGDMIKSVLVHEIGHAITVNSGNNDFWNEIDKIRSSYLKNIKKDDINNKDFISNYARTNRYEFVAEAFCQGYLSKEYGQYTKQVMEQMDKHFKSEYQQKLALNSKKNDENQEQDFWVEGFGLGYPASEEDYEDFKKQQN